MRAISSTTTSCVLYSIAINDCLPQLIDMGTSFDSEVEDLKQQVDRMEQQLATKENQLSMKERQLVAKDRDITNLKSDLQKMTVRANQAERKFLDLQGKQKVP